MTALRLVAKETYLRQVKTWSFVAMILTPFTLLLFGAIGGIVGRSFAAHSAQDQIAVYSSHTAYQKALGDLPDVKMASSLSEAKKDLSKEKISAYLVVEEENGNIVATLYGNKRLPESQKESVMSQLNQLQGKLNKEQAGLSEEQEQILAKTVTYQEKIEEKKDILAAVRGTVYFSLCILLYMLLMTYAGLVAQEIAGEKGAKIMEIIFSSVPPKTYFYGRMLGLFGVVLTHMGIYLLLGGLSLMQLSGQSSFLPKEVNLSEVTGAILEVLDSRILLFIIVGLMLYIVLAALCGSLVVRQEDINKALQPLIYFVILVFMSAFGMGIGGQDNVIISVLSYLPFFSSFFMPIRMIYGHASSLSIWLSLALLVGTLAFFLRAIASSYAALILQKDDIGILQALKRAFLPN